MLSISKPQSEESLLRTACDTLAARLPRKWRCDLEKPTPSKRGRIRGPSPVAMKLCSPGRVEGDLLVVAQPAINRRDVHRILSQFSRSEERRSLLVVGRYLSPPVRRLLSTANVSYMDATGNISLTVDRPAIYIQETGASSDPWRTEAGGLSSLKGGPAAKVVRALVDFRPPVGIRELSGRSGASLGSTARVVDLLLNEGLVDKSKEGTVTAVDWPALLERWSDDYSFLLSNETQVFIEPRGLTVLLDKLRQVSWRYAITGSLAVSEVVSYAESRTGMLFVDDIDQAVDTLGLHSVDSGANVLISIPRDSVVFERTWRQTDLTFAALSQVAADLLTSSGRGPTEGKALIDWMKLNECDWRK